MARHANGNVDAEELHKLGPVAVLLYDMQNLVGHWHKEAGGSIREARPRNHTNQIFWAAALNLDESTWQDWMSGTSTRCSARSVSAWI